MNKTILLLTLISFVFVSHVSAQDALPENVLEKLKEATVFVKVSVPGQDGTGSGFLIGVKNGCGYIATNEHVVRSKRGTRRVEVVFNSGSKQSKSYVAQVVGEDKSRDLAILKISGTNFPEPISIKTSVKLRETLPVYILGFPFGDALSTNKSGPGVTVGRGIISSVRKDDYGDVQSIQIDGDINPGNSGGPVVTPEGKLVGVSVATVMGTQISLAIPCKSVRDLLFGRVQSLSIDQQQVDSGRVLLKIKATLIDPINNMRGVTMHIVEKSKVKKLAPKDDGSWERISKASKEAKLKIKENVATGQLNLKGSPGKRVVYLQQVKFVNGRGKTAYTQPAEITVRFPDRKVASNKRKKSNDDDDWLHKDDDTSGDTTAQNSTGDKSASGGEEGWLGTESDRVIAKGKPVQTNQSLVEDEFTVIDLECKELKLDADEIIANFAWSKDGNYLYIVQKNGLLRKIAVPELVEKVALKIPGDCSWLEMSAEGLCVVVNGLQELWVIDEKTLKTDRRIPIASARSIATSPDLSIGFARGATRQSGLMVLDLKKGKTIREYSTRDFRDQRIKKHRDGVVLSEFKMPKVSPNGNHLFCVGFECLHKFRIDGNELEYLEMGPRIGSNPQRIEVSQDSKYVALPSGGGNGSAGYATYVYSTKNILDPVITIKSGAYPRTLGFDKKAKMIYAQNSGVSLITFSPTGQRKKEYSIPNMRSTRYLSVHPKGGQLVIMADKKLTWAKFAYE